MNEERIKKMLATLENELAEIKKMHLEGYYTTREYRELSEIPKERINTLKWVLNIRNDKDFYENVLFDIEYNNFNIW